MKRLLFLLLILISLVFFSCNSGQFSGDQGSVSFDVSKAEDYICRNVSQNITLLQSYNSTYDEREFVSYTIKVKVSTEGDYEDGVENEYSKKLNEILNAAAPDQAILNFVKDSLANRITLKGIPVGSNIKVKLLITSAITLDEQAFKQKLAAASVSQAFIDSLVSSVLQEMNAQTQTWNGESAGFTVKKGVNKVNIRVKGLKFADYEYEEEEGTEIILYNEDALYAFSPNLLKSRKILTPKTYQLNKAYDDFVIDKNNNLYYAINDIDEKKLYIYKENTLLEDADMTDYSFAGLYLEQNTGSLFFARTNSSDIYVSLINSENEILSDSLNDEDFAYLNDYAISFGEPVTTADGVQYEGFLYLAIFCSTGWPQKMQINRYPVTYTIIEGVESFEINDDEETWKVNSFYPEANDNSFLGRLVASQKPAALISDMMVQGDNLYALYREVFISKEPPEVNIWGDDVSPINIDPYYSRGLIFRINTASSESFMKKPDLIGQPSITEKQTFSIQRNFTYSDDAVNFQEQTSPATINYNVYQSQTCLFGPEKFVAIKPKKLVIADDGYFFYKDDDNLYFKNINRVIELNEDTLEQKSYELKTSVPIHFDDEEENNIEYKLNSSGTGYSGLDVTLKCIKAN